MDFWCRKCGARGGSSQRIMQCENCQAGVWVRPNPPPSPATHFGQVLAALYSFPAALFAVVYVGFAILPHYFLNIIGGIMLLVASIKYARTTMSVGPEGVKFPEVDIGEMFESRYVWLSIVFTLVFTVAPLALLFWGGVEAARGGNAVLPIVGGVFLIVYAPMGLVLMLQSNSVGGLLAFHVGIRLIVHDFVAYLGLAALFGASQALVYMTKGAVESLSGGAHLVGLMVSSTVYAFATMFTFGIAGLYIRKHARAFDFPVDDADWVLAMEHYNVGFAETGSPPPAVPSPSPPAPGPVLVGTLVEDDDPPPLVGTLVD